MTLIPLFLWKDVRYTELFSLPRFFTQFLEISPHKETLVNAKVAIVQRHILGSFQTSMMKLLRK